MEIKRYKEFNEAVKTPCQTPDTIFKTKISGDKISIDIELPMELQLDEEEATILEKNMHNALELSLAKYFV